MAIRKNKNGTWLVHVDRKGMPRVRKSFPTREQAEQFERDYIVSNAAAEKSRLGDDIRRLKDLSKLWYQYHGVNLSDGARMQKCIDRVADGVGNPVACQLTPEVFVSHRYKLLQKGYAPVTLNKNHRYLSAMYTKLKKLGVINYANPIAEVEMIKIHERQLSYLSRKQIDILFESIKNGCQNTSVWYVAQLCVRTGARWGEAEKLKMKQLHNGMVTFEFTKSKKTRAIPIDPVFYRQLIEFAAYKNPNDRIFKNCYGAFRRSVARSGIETPTGQMSHILRHTFASHFVINGGNILSLQRILGHSDISITMRYAHLSPDHLQDALRLNPLAKLAVDIANNSQ